MIRFLRFGLPLLFCGLAVSTYAQQTIYVNGTTGDDAWDGLCEVWDGDTCGPKWSIKGGIGAAQNGDTVIVADGLYMDWANMQIEFEGKAITVRSANGPETCTLDGNEHARSFWFHEQETASSVLDGFTLTGGNSNEGSGIICDGSSPTIKNCIITDNLAHNSGGGIVLLNSSAIIKDCTFSNNRADGDSLGGGGIYCFNSTPTITNCTFNGNSAYVGGGLFFHEGNPTIKNCLIFDNLGEWYGGGLYGYGPGSATITNCTFADNHSGAYGGGLYGLDEFDPTITSCAFSYNTGDYGPQIALEWFSNPTLWYNDVQGGQADVFISTASFIHWEAGNIEDEALFVDPNQGDFHLATDSPCIGAGDPAETGIGQVDLDGEPRVMGGRVEMGVDEFTDRSFLYGDMNCDGVANSLDIDPFTLAITEPTGYEAQYPSCNIDNGDINSDGSLNSLDIDPFVEILTRG